MPISGSHLISESFNFISRHTGQQRRKGDANSARQYQVHGKRRVKERP